MFVLLCWVFIFQHHSIMFALMLLCCVAKCDNEMVTDRFWAWYYHVQCFIWITFWIKSSTCLLCAPYTFKIQSFSRPLHIAYVLTKLEFNWRMFCYPRPNLWPRGTEEVLDIDGAHTHNVTRMKLVTFSRQSACGMFG